MELFNRRQALKAILSGVAIAGGTGILLSMDNQGSPKEKTRPEPPPALPGNLVKEYVSAAHNDLEKVRKMLEATPDLLHASHDWGAGDFESAIEAAGHMGDREMAAYLISKGARVNIFQYAMLGELEIVQSLVKFNPNVIKSDGPHGLDLKHHARKGGDKASEVLKFLDTLY